MGTYIQILYQVVFGAKNKQSFMNEKNKDFLFNYMAAISRNLKTIPYIIGGHENHVHIIIALHPTISLSNYVKQLKTASNHMMKESQSRELFKSFHNWQAGYGGFTYAYSSKDNLMRYVKRQAEHHRKITFQEELIGLFEEFGIEYDLQYVFE